MPIFTFSPTDSFGNRTDGLCFGLDHAGEKSVLLFTYLGALYKYAGKAFARENSRPPIRTFFARDELLGYLRSARDGKCTTITLDSGDAPKEVEVDISNAIEKLNEPAVDHTEGVRPRDMATAREMFMQACRFNLSEHFLLNQMLHWSTPPQVQSDGINQAARFSIDVSAHGFPPTCVSGVVCGAFAAEVYLKAIACLEGRQPRHSHRLDDLFGDLSPEWKARLESAFNFVKGQSYANRVALGGEDEARAVETLEQCLVLGSQAFEAWRYLYEGEPNSIVAGVVTESIRHAIVDYVPAWKELVVYLNDPYRRPAPQC